jgi:hypothetical protein
MTTKKRRFELRTDEATDRLISEAGARSRRSWGSCYEITKTIDAATENVTRSARSRFLYRSWLVTEFLRQPGGFSVSALCPIASARDSPTMPF